VVADEVKTWPAPPPSPTETITSTLGELNAHVAAVVEIMTAMSATITDIDHTNGRRRDDDRRPGHHRGRPTAQVSAAVDRLDGLAMR
jgi:methyl-accepting chemotaxis protein